MANIEGVVRMKKLAKIITVLGSASAAVGAITLICAFIPLPSYLQSLRMTLMPIGAIFLIWLGIFPMIVGGMLWGCAWIVEGFITPSSN